MSTYDNAFAVATAGDHPRNARRLCQEAARTASGLLRLARSQSFVRLFLALSTVFWILWQASLYLDAVLDMRQRRVEAVEATRRARDLLAKTLGTYVADLRILSRSENLHRLATGQAATADALAREFRVFASEKPSIAQLRYLDRQGNEVVRVERLGGDVTIADPKDLQNKADRYYFQQAIELPPGGLYVSPIDLNVEHGEIVTPWTPVVRIATPLQQRAGGKVAGVVVVNIAAEDLINDVSGAGPSRQAPMQLLNAEGYWLAGVARERLWGFMFGRDTTMARKSPEIWQRIAGQASGSFLSGGSFYVFQTFRPPLYHSAGGQLSPVRSDGAAWTILGRVPAISLDDLWRVDRLPIALGALLVIAVICLFWSRAAEARREAIAIKRRTEAEMVRVERLASLGSLVAGVAHELNTPIGAAVTVASTLSIQTARFREEVASGQIRRSMLDSFLTDLRDGTAMLVRGLDRAADLIRHLKQVAVDQASEQRRVFRIADLVHDVVTSVRPQLKHCAATLEIQVDPDAELDSYPGPLSQVLLNLVANAQLHGFDDDQTGEVVIAARALPSDQVEIVVRDNGKGMPTDRLNRIFEPFFTTRLGEGGSGLGLSIVFNIVTSVLGGTIRAESQEGQGTTMIVQLPVSAPATPDSHPRTTYHVDG